MTRNKFSKGIKRFIFLLSRSLLIVAVMMTATQFFYGIGSASAVAVITATKTDALQVDADNSGSVTPGDTLRYTITIQNSGDQDATNAVFNDTIDNNTAFVPGSLQTTPLARNDTASTVGNVQLSVSAPGVLANDSDPDGSGGLAVTPFSGSSANGGQVNLAADGSFTYNPPPGFSGTDSFTYTVNDGESNTDSATVTIAVGQVVWFINNAVGGPGDGRFTSPFNSIANFDSLAADEAGDYIFIYQGSGAYSGAITLLNTQQLIGHGVGLTISPNLAIAAASRPTIANVALASGNTVRGLNISATSGNGISGTSVGALTINNVSVTQTGGTAVSLGGGNSSMAVTFDSVSSTAGGTGGILLNNNSGSFTVNGGTIDPGSGHGIQVTNPTAGPLNFTLTNSTITDSSAGFNGINFSTASTGSFGTITITNNTISNNGSTGLRADIHGTGSIAKIDIGSNTFTGNPIGVDLVTTDTASIDFDIHNNGTMNGTQTQVSIAANDATANNGVGPTMEGYIRNNTITTSPTGSIFIAVSVVSNGDGNITADINNNTITNFGFIGINVESRNGTGDVHARIANNSATTTASFPSYGMLLRSGGGTAGETSLLCVNLSGNDMNAGSSPLDYFLDRNNTATTVFQIQGLSPSPANETQAAAYVASTDAGSTAAAFPATYTASTCATVSFASAPSNIFLAQNSEGSAGLSSVQNYFALFAALRTKAADWAQDAIAASRVSTAHASPLLALITPVSLGTLNPGESITITFDVTINAGFSGTSVSNQGNVTADGGINILTDDPDTVAPNDPTVTPVVVSAPDLIIAKSHTGNFTQGQTGAQYTISVTNTGSVTTSGTVTVVDTLPAGLTATALSGTGWSCTLATLTCTRSDALASNTSYPDITLTVDVASNAPASVTNSAMVSGGGEVNTGNNTASDPTTIMVDPQQTGGTLVVNSTNDPGTGGCTTGECTLREAITQANSDSIATTINFDIAGTGPHVITVTGTDLPSITAPVTIDGLPNEVGATCPLPTGPLGIQINAAVNRVDGLRLEAGSDGSSIRGLSITNFDDDAIEVLSTNNSITCNYLGLAADGSTPGGNRWGVFLTSSSSGSTVGGTNAGDANVIAHNTNDGVVLHGSNNTVRGNIIRSHADAGIDAISNGTGNRFSQNSIHSNNNLGIDIDTDGVNANDAGDGDSGTNNRQNFPVLSSVTAAGVVNGSLDSLATNTAYPVQIEFFANTTCDSSGNGEGEVYLGSISIAAPGNFSTTLTLVSGKDFITATATDNNGNTSEFSACQLAPASQPPTAVANSYSTNEDTPLNVAAPGVLGNDSDPDTGDTITAVLVSGPSNAASFTLNSDGSFSYTPNANFNGPDSFSYKARDNHNLESDPVTVSITVNPANDVPTVAVAAAVACTSSASGTMNLTVADLDSPAGSLTLSGSSSDTKVVPTANIVFGGSGANRTVAISALPQKSMKSATVTITVSDGTATSTTTIKVIVGTDKNETFNGSSGADMIFGLNGKNTINGGDGIDVLCGGNGIDTISGGNDNDSIHGGNGNDILRGNDGDDRLTGGNGADSFSGGSGTDTATDFNAGQGDTQDGTIP